MELFAHLTNRDNKRIEQTLEEHCMNVAEYAAKSIGSTGIYHTAYLAGILHDAGKAKSEFVEYIEKAYQGEKVIRGRCNKAAGIYNGETGMFNELGAEHIVSAHHRHALRRGHQLPQTDSLLIHVHHNSTPFCVVFFKSWTCRRLH